MTAGGSRRRLVWAIAWRFLRGRQRSRLLDGTARAALVATALGVAAMVIAMALMSGYRRDLRQKLLGGNAAVIVYPLAPEAFRLDPEVRRRIAALPGVVELRRVAYGQGTLAGGGVAEGVDVTVRGVPPGEEAGPPGRLAPPSARVAAATSDRPPEVVVGEELAHRLGLAPGDTARLMVLGLEAGRPRFRYRGVRVAGTLATGLSEFDRRLVLADLALLQGLAGKEVGFGLFELVTSDLAGTAGLAAALRELLGPDYLIRDWRELNAELFAALELQQIALFFVLGLIVLVSTFNVASTLVVLVRERMRHIGVLAALGLGPRQLRGVFLLFGGFVSLVGTVAGLALGTLVAWLLTRYELIRFGPEVAEVYFLSSVSFQVRWLDLAAIVGFTLTVTALACWLPARRAATVRPAAALRYE